MGHLALKMFGEAVNAFVFATNTVVDVASQQNVAGGGGGFVGGPSCPTP